MIDIHKEEFDIETGILNSTITVYCSNAKNINKYLLEYINDKDYSEFRYVYNSSLGSKINIKGKDNNDGTYLIKIIINYIKYSVKFR